MIHFSDNYQLLYSHSGEKSESSDRLREANTVNGTSGEQTF